MERQREQVRAGLARMLEDAVSSDAWGQRIEAAAGYRALVAALDEHSSGLGPVQFSTDERRKLAKLSVSVDARLRSVNDEVTGPVSLDDMRLLPPVLQQLLDPKHARTPFPLSLEQLTTAGSRRPTTDSSRSGTSSSTTGSDAAGDVKPNKGGTLLPAPVGFAPGQVQITLRVERIGLKDATQYIDPFLTVSVMSPEGRLVDPQQDTPVSMQRSQNHIQFGSNVVELQTPLSSWPSDACIFIEFKHFKPKKNKISTRCWSFMEMDEIKEGGAALEIYRKPTDPRHRKLGLLSKKPLYLHVHLTLHKH